MERDDLVRLFAALAAEDVAYVLVGGVAMNIARVGDRFGFEDLQSETRDLGGVPVRLATPATLYAMKHDTVRPVDRADAERLRDAFGVGTGA